MKIENHRLLHDDGTPYPYRESPNKPGKEVEALYLVQHYTAGGSKEAAVEWLCYEGAEASAHVVVGRGGYDDVTQLVPFNEIAWHAGISRWHNFVGMNKYSLGIEIDNAGRLQRHGDYWRSWFGREYEDGDVLVATHKFESHPSGWHLYTPTQIQTVLHLSKLLVKTYGLRDVLGHEDVAIPVGRKVDPGPAFPMHSVRARAMGRAADEPEWYATTEWLNIRKGPSTQFDKLDFGPLSPGYRVQILERRGRWVLVRVGDAVCNPQDNEGWVHSYYLERV
jgi:N-acetylmuramoyl-L-alanine amidase